MQNILFRKSSEYAVAGLTISQNTDNLIEVTDRNRKGILQELIENLLKEEKDDEHAYSFKLHNSEGYEKVIPLTKETPTELSPLNINTIAYRQKKKQKK